MVSFFLTLTFSPTVMALSDTTCGDVLRWCEDPQNFIDKRCPHDTTAPEFDPTTCQTLYNTIAQDDCVVRAFRGGWAYPSAPFSSDNPCADVQLPYGDYSEDSLDISAAAAACENFSFSNVLCVDEFNKLNPSENDFIRALRCIFAAARLPEFQADRDAKECLKFAADSLGDEDSSDSSSDSVGQKTFDTDSHLAIMIRDSNYCIDSPNHKNNGVAHMWECADTNWNQMWTHTSSEQLKLFTTEWCLDGQPQDGGTVHLWECGWDNWNQMWTYDASSGQIKLKQTNYCLSIAFYAPTDPFPNVMEHGSLNGVELQMWTCEDIWTQSFTLGEEGSVERPASSTLVDDENKIPSTPAKADSSEPLKRRLLTMMKA